MTRAAILTAAGLSTRMGQPKALVPWQGAPLLAFQLAALADWDEVVVVLGHEAERIRAAVPLPAHARYVFNPAYHEGRSSSIAAGARALCRDHASLLVVAVDQPLVPALLPELCEAAGVEAIARPVFEGRGGHPVVFGGSLLGELYHVAQWPQGLRSLLRRDPARVRDVPMTNPLVLLDLNRPEDLAAALS